MNIDKLHADWMERYKSYARFFLGADTSTAHVINCCDKPIADPITGMPHDYVYEGKMKLPEKSASACLAMAKFSQSSLMNPPSIKGLDLEEYPKATFNLRSLLLASYPRDVKTDMFKGDNIGIYVLIADEEIDEDEVPMFVSFGGLGVMLMEKCRMLLSEASTDDQVVDLCADRYLIFDTSEPKDEK
jgi:hypothetical protein